MSEKSDWSRKIVRLKLRVEYDVVLHIGTIDINTHCVNDNERNMLEQGSDASGSLATFYRIAETSLSHGCYMYLYQVVNLNDSGHGDSVDFYSFTVPTIYDIHGYLTEVFVVSEKIVSETLVDAYRTYAEKAISKMDII